MTLHNRDIVSCIPLTHHIRRSYKLTYKTKFLLAWCFQIWKWCRKKRQNKVDNLRIVLLINERKSRLCSFFNVAFYFCLFSTNQSQSFRSVNFVSRLVSHRFPKKRTKEFICFVCFFTLYGKSNSSVRFLGESMAHHSAFQN